MRSAVVALSLLALCAIAAPSAANAANVTVFAAASLKDAMDAQKQAFEAATGNKVTVSYGGSNTLAKQIEAGAPADLFISADLDWMDYLDRRHLLAQGTRVTLLTNTLVLVAPSASKAHLTIGPGFELAQALGSDKLAMANPDSVPAGKYGKSALETLHVWATVEKQVARTENVRAALALVSRGEAAFGIVYGTDARANKGVRVIGTFPADAHPPILYPAALVAGTRSPAAKALLDYLRSAAAAAVWERFGFVSAL